MSGAPAWDDDPLVAGWSGLPALERSVTADVCVVGLGGSGLAAVESAIERGQRVVGVDAGRVGAGAAGRNGGFLLGGPRRSCTTHYGRGATVPQTCTGRRSRNSTTSNSCSGQR